MVALSMLISVFHAEPEFFDDLIHLIARSLINWIAISMYRQMEYCFKSLPETKWSYITQHLQTC